MLLSMHAGGIIAGGYDPSVQKAVGIILTLLICCIWVLPNCTINVSANKAIIVSDNLKNEDSQVESSFSGNRVIKAQRELQAGFHWKYFWEKPVAEVDMSRQRTIENDPDDPKKQYTLKDRKLIKIKWRIFYAPLPGSIVKLNRTKPEDIKKRIYDRVDGFVQGFVGELESIGFGQKQMDEMREAYIARFKDNEHIDDEEKEMGIWTSNLEVIDFDDPKEVQQARNFEEVMLTNIRLANKIVNESNGKIHPNDALKMVLVGSGKANIDFIELAGILPSSQGGQKKNPKNGGQHGSGNKNI
jgi:hypothetical protein